MAAASIQRRGSYQSSSVSTRQEEARRLYRRQRRGPLGGGVWLVFALQAVLRSEVVEVWQEGFGTSSAMGFGRR
jgi:hypothetical protein